MVDFEKYLDKYIELALVEGLQLKKGDVLLIRADVKIADFVQKVVAHAYAKEAEEVLVYYEDEQLKLLRGLYGADKIFDECPESKVALYNETVARGGKVLSIVSPNTELMKDVDPTRILRENKAAAGPMKNFRTSMLEDLTSWTIIAVPNAAWAKQVFPEIKTSEEAIAALWKAILDAGHLFDGEDELANWEAHSNKLKEMVDKLNTYQFTALHYTNGLGTDLRVGLPTGHIWRGGLSENLRTGEWFSPNIPTEEVFTLPDANRVDGVVYSSKPLVYMGQVIDEFALTFKDGAVVDCHAKKGEVLLKELIQVDEGAKRLGEVALVPYHSPISLSGRLFYNTLYDENAACHLALGMAYVPTLDGAAEKNEAELKEIGFNTSIIHEDFMLGTADLDIVGIKADGEKIQVFKDGNFVI